MAILISNEIKNTLHQELSNANESVQIITAYCKLNTMHQLNIVIPEIISDKRLMVRFRMEDILKSSTDFEAIEFCLENRWKVYFRFDLHVKTYIVDNKRGIIGSANATNSGLGFNHSPNLEMATLVNMEPGDIDKIQRLYQHSILADKQLLNKMKMEISEVPSARKGQCFSWSNEINSLFKSHVETLFSYELPDDDRIDGYIPFLDSDFGGDLDEFKDTFRWSNAYMWLLDTVKKHNGEAYFGQLSADLHSALISDPKPYRKDVKLMLANLLALVEKLKMADLIVDCPNYSQRVRSVH